MVSGRAALKNYHTDLTSSKNSMSYHYKNEVANISFFHNKMEKLFHSLLFNLKNFLN